MKNIILLLFFIIALNGCNNSEPVSLNEKERIISNFDNLLENDLEEDNINGCISFALIKGNEVLLSKTYGFLDAVKKAKADTNTIFRVASITKSFAGFLLLKLAQDDVLSLDDPVEKYLPEIKSLENYSEMSPITFKQLASHTSGLEREPRYREANSGSLEEWEDKVLKSIPETSFRSKPDERFGYSNIGYAILGLAISRAANTPYIELVKTSILIPLKMNNTYFSIRNEKLGYLATGMAGGPTAELDYERPLREHTERGFRIPNGGLYSTPNDMVKFMKACMGYSKILDKENLQLLSTTQTPTTRLRSNYSFGFDLYSDQVINTFGHAGLMPGYSAHFEIEKNSGYGIVIMRNYNFGNTNLDLRANALLRKLSATE